ncbi:MAG: outer membrane protein assembly factor BamA [bacterium]|nr:outer membrane protein assembly factor BamA [bacterium]
MRVQTTVVFRLLLCVAAGLILGAGWEGLAVKEINIQGNRKIERQAILHKIQTKIGQPFSQGKIDQDIKAIYAIGYFENIKVDVKEVEGGLSVTYIVTERPLIKKITFSGNKKIKTETLQEKIDLTSGSILNPYLVKKNVQGLTQFYRDEGYYLVQISYRTEKISEDQIELIFDIQEGKKVKIRQVIIEGNRSYSEKELKKVLKTKKRGLFSFITSSGYLKKDVLSQDIDRLEDFYLNHGFIHVAIGEPKVSFDPQKQGLTITIPLSEGDQYRIGKIRIEGNKVISTSQIYLQLRIREGEIFNRAKLRQDVSAIQDLYANQGYLFTHILPMTNEIPEEKKVDLTLKIEEGGLTYVNRIKILGNVKTRDKVIRREMEVQEGDIFRSHKVRQSYNNINNLGFFEEVNLDIQPEPEKNKVDLLIKVKERMTGQMSIGGGYSSVDNFVGTAEIKQGNLFGLGEQLFLSAEISSRRSTYDLGFTEPWLFDIPLSAGFDIYYVDKEFDTFTKTSRGGDLRLGYPVAEYSRLSGTYLYEKVNIKVEDPNSASYDIREAEGKSSTSSLRLSLARDSRDNRIKPTSGSLNRISFQFAGGFLGGSNYFTKTILESGWHFPIWKQLVLSLHGKIGYAAGYESRPLPVFERFYVGGLDTVRGYRDRSIGPKDERGDPVGGNKLVVTNVEFNFPIYDIIRGVIFWDAGNVFVEGEEFFDQPLRMGAGLGVRFFTPIGPLRLDWGRVINYRPEDRSRSQIHFAIGTYF